MNNLIKLSSATDYITVKISAKEIAIDSYVTTDNMLQNKEGVIFAEKVPVNYSINKYKKDDILVANIRPYLKKIWYADKNGGCSSDVLIFRVKKGYHPKFVYYSMFRDDFFIHIMNGKKGTKMPRGDKNQIMDFEIPNFEITLQKQIASVLSNLDAKIELNNRINRELEQMAKLLYDYWFVQFDFPDANGKPYKSNGGKMIYSKELKREIPDGWEEEKLSNRITEIKSGDWGSETPHGNYTTKVNCIRGADLNGFNGLEQSNPPVRFIHKDNAFKILAEGDIVIEISGGSPTQSTGRLSFITEASMKRFENPLICSNFCKPITLKNPELVYVFVYEWNKLYDNNVFFNYEGKTSGIKNLLFDVFAKSYKTVIPEDSVVKKFNKIVESIHKKKHANLTENHHLTTLRDWLLPMLMNGQVRVGEAGKKEYQPNETEMDLAAELGGGNI